MRFCPGGIGARAPAAGTEPSQGDGHVPDVEPERVPLGEGKLGEQVRGKIHELVAVKAEKVVVGAGDCVEAGGGTRVRGAGGQPQPDQGFQHPVDGGSREPREPGVEIVVELVGGRVVLPIEEGLQDGPSLPGDGEPTGPAPILELLDPVLFESRLPTHLI
jgi:hypothetical protein